MTKTIDPFNIKNVEELIFTLKEYATENGKYNPKTKVKVAIDEEWNAIGKTAIATDSETNNIVLYPINPDSIQK
tara:strand:- start:2335 stop:2556 length:222 start_codon:yes stop_codon:yes gene_type:complete